MLPPIDISYIAEELRMLSDELVDAYEDRKGDTATEPQILLEALADLFEGLRRLEDDGAVPRSIDEPTPSRSKDLRTLGDQGIDLLARLAALANRLLSPQQAHTIEELALPLACWIARRGGELGYLTPVVEGAASLANRIRRPSELGQLYGLLTEVIDAVDPRISQDEGAADPSRPWRMLLLNRAIVATRAHRLELMEEAFEAVVEYLPDDAPAFFREGMEQMDTLNYPPQVRKVMQRYHEQCSGQRVLH